MSNPITSCSSGGCSPPPSGAAPTCATGSCFPSTVTSTMTSCTPTKFPPFMEAYCSSKRPYPPFSVVIHKGVIWQNAEDEYAAPGDCNTSWKQINFAVLFGRLLELLECPDCNLTYRKFDAGCCNPIPMKGDVRCHGGRLWISVEDDNCSTPSADNPKWVLGLDKDQILEELYKLMKATDDRLETAELVNGTSSVKLTNLEGHVITLDLTPAIKRLLLWDMIDFMGISDCGVSTADDRLLILDNASKKLKCTLTYDALTQRLTKATTTVYGIVRLNSGDNAADGSSTDALTSQALVKLIAGATPNNAVRQAILSLLHATLTDPNSQLNNDVENIVTDVVDCDYLKGMSMDCVPICP